MNDHTVPASAIDEKFIQILMEELDWETPSSAPGEGQSPSGPSAAPAVTKQNGPSAPSSPAADPGHFPVSSSALPFDEMPPGQLYLRVIDLGGFEQTVKLSEQPVTIGRSRTNTVVVRCSRVSRNHLRIWLDGPAIWVEETSDRQRMCVNGVRMSRSRLRANDEVRVGDVRIYVEREDTNLMS
jgi:hypothetical protein